MKLLLIPFLLTLFTTFSIHAAEKSEEKRLDEIAERGSHVMPFDLEKTTHIFTQTPNGGIQQVVAKNKSDTGQINLIRAHLSEISNEFKHSNFSNPEKIHGKNMPGLAELKAAQPDQIKFEYEELPGGAQITYSTEVEKLKQAIHQWFDAQFNDHACHAAPGHSRQLMRAISK